MDAMIFAAGHGTRLRPLTDALPKALVPVGGVPMLRRVAQQLIAAGATRLIINTHAHAELVEAYVEAEDGFGVECILSHEEGHALETGGGLAYAARHFRTDAPFFLHNADILTDLPLREMLAVHQEARSLVTLATRDYSGGRGFLFDPSGLCGHVNERGSRSYFRHTGSNVTPLAFAGVHVCSAALLAHLPSGKYSLTEGYGRLAGLGHPIRPFEIRDALWMDIGSHERLAEANRLFDPPA